MQSTSITDRYRLVHEYQIPDFAGASIRDIIDRVARKHGLTTLDLISHRRSDPVVKARHEAMWRARTETTHSLPSIGRIFRRDHTSVIYGISKHEKRIASNAAARDPAANIGRYIAKAAPLGPVTVKSVSVSGNNHHP